MKIEVKEKEGVAILYLKGNIDINASDLVETIGWILKYKSKNIICNFKEVNLVDYIGISIIAVAYKNVLNHRGKLRICNVPRHLKNLFSIVGLNRVFTYYESEEGALQSLKEEEKILDILSKKLRRRFKRIPFHTTIEYRQKFSPQDNFYKGRVINLSAMGVFIVTRKIFSIGDILLVRIYLKSKPYKILETEAKVVWIADQRIQPYDYPGMGLEFYNIDTQKQQEIVEFVEKHASTILGLNDES
ncbi:MAG: hypothetical protein B6D56_07695 [Candidatus Omnitrophica bacterium 4484_70.1]|nr:MAG: hypothetical protein B6D56_07695 [Candidatus Omnitrophica bacterium 4484_70.1]